jgi:hypothetical protein
MWLEMMERWWRDDEETKKQVRLAKSPPAEVAAEHLQKGWWVPEGGFNMRYRKGGINMMYRKGGFNMRYRKGGFDRYGIEREGLIGVV